MSILNRPEFHDEEAAYAYVESRLWPNGPVCPKCGENERITKMQGKSTRIGTYKCRACRKPFTVKVGTIFESSHIKMHLWLQAIYLMCASKKGISSNQLHRTLGVTLKTAWFMSHRIREAMRELTLHIGDRSCGIDSATDDQIAELLAPKEYCVTEIEGVLEQINIHAHANVFFIYPDAGPHRVKCHFDDRLRYDAMGGLGQKVAVRGEAGYRRDYPNEIRVEGIEIFPPDDELPTFEDLRGAAANEFAGLPPSEELIAELRDEWT